MYMYKLLMKYSMWKGTITPSKKLVCEWLLFNPKWPWYSWCNLFSPWYSWCNLFSPWYSWCNLFSPWYSWRIAHLGLNNNHSLIPWPKINRFYLYYCLFISVLLFEIYISRGESWDPIHWSNPATLLCLFQART
jgi:hypothetical protein